ncbi:hypothetical protein SFRURICE_015789 [Spodoptera frugiperda]|nr:hypothetical protein SFRURICE_015789 [Spodoptera frugiperda]
MGKTHSKTEDKEVSLNQNAAGSNKATIYENIEVQNHMMTTNILLAAALTIGITAIIYFGCQKWRKNERKWMERKMRFEFIRRLSIAQSDENPKASEILRPINEKLAIKRFADGLRNRRLSTIISARDYSQLKDAVRAAEDEELGQPSSSNNIFNATQRRGNQFNYYSSSRISHLWVE